MHRQQLKLLLTDDLLLQGHWEKRTLLAQRASFNTLDNWGHKIPIQSTKQKTKTKRRERTTGKKRLKGHGPGYTQCTRLHTTTTAICACVVLSVFVGTCEESLCDGRTFLLTFTSTVTDIYTVLQLGCL